MKRNLNHFLKSNLINFQTHKKSCTTKNKQIVHERYPFSFTSWLLFVIFLVGGLKVWPQVPVKQYRFPRLVPTLIMELILPRLTLILFNCGISNSFD